MIEAKLGENLYTFISRMIKDCQLKGVERQQVVFNEIVIMVYSKSYFGDLCTIYDLKCSIRRMKQR